MGKENICIKLPIKKAKDTKIIYEELLRLNQYLPVHCSMCHKSIISFSNIYFLEDEFYYFVIQIKSSTILFRLTDYKHLVLLKQEEPAIQFNSVLKSLINQNSIIKISISDKILEAASPKMLYSILISQENEVSCHNI